MGDIFEKEVSKCNSLKELCVTARRKPLTVSHVQKVLLSQIFKCLQLKEKFTVFYAASPQPIKAIKMNVSRIAVS